jgi:hypothetical protein
VRKVGGRGQDVALRTMKKPYKEWTDMGVWCVGERREAALHTTNT